MYSNFGELAYSIKNYIDEVSQVKQKSFKIESLDDMQKALDSLPELKKLSGNLQKHVTISSEISRLVDERKLMDVSRVEQELATKKDANHFNVYLFLDNIR